MIRRSVLSFAVVSALSIISTSAQSAEVMTPIQFQDDLKNYMYDRNLELKSATGRVFEMNVPEEDIAHGNQNISLNENWIDSPGNHKSLIIKTSATSNNNEAIYINGQGSDPHGSRAELELLDFQHTEISSEHGTAIKLEGHSNIEVGPSAINMAVYAMFKDGVGGVEDPRDKEHPDDYIVEQYEKYKNDPAYKKYYESSYQSVMDRTLTISGKDYAINAEGSLNTDAFEGPYIELNVGSLTVNGAIRLTNGAGMDIGYANVSELAGTNWVEPEYIDASDEYRKDISISSDNRDIPTLQVDQGSMVLMAAETVKIENKAKNGEAIYIGTGESLKGMPTVVSIAAKNQLHIKGDIVIDRAEDDSKTFLKIASDKHLQINGNIYVWNTSKSQNAVNLVLDGKKTTFTGQIYDRVKESNDSEPVLMTLQEDPSNDYTNLDAIGTQISVGNGAEMFLTDTSVITGVKSNGGRLSLANNDLTVKSLTKLGDTTFVIDTVKEKQISLEQIGIDSSDVVSYRATSTQPSIFVEVSNADRIYNDDEIEKIIVFGNAVDNKSHKVTIVENAHNPGQSVSIGEDGRATSSHTSSNTSVSESLSDIAGLQVLAWRAQINDVNKRLGDLRTYDGQAGAWARVYGGETEYGDRDLENKHTTVQIGADTKFANNFYFGTTASYTDGNGDMANGSTDDRSYSLGLYGGWLADNGQFVDVIVKATNMKTDFDLAYVGGEHSSGSFDTWGSSIAIEYGWRFNCPSTNFWVEPQAEISYGYLDNVNYTTNDGVKAQQDSLESLVGRLGIAVGANFDQGSAYLKASVAHDWKAETSIQMSNGLAKLEEDLGGTWGEFALGATYNFGNDLVAYGEFQTTAASDVKSPYQWNVGVRYLF